MSVLRRLDPETADQVPIVHRIVGLRNILIHGYAQVNNETVWRAATTDLEEVVATVEPLLAESSPPDTSPSI